MADKIKNNREIAGKTGPERKEHKDDSGFEELGERRREFIEGVSEVVEGAESSEGVADKVSDRTGEDKRKAASGGAVADVKTGKPLTIPDVDVMIIQISTKIKKELSALEKERKRLMKNPAKFSPFKLNEIMMRIRELRDILADLAYQTADNIKQLWQKFVKGVK